MHIGESLDEIELIEQQTGALREFLESLNAWDASGLPQSMTQVVSAFCRLHRPMLIHCNYLNPNTPIASRATIVYCPRTHSAFGHVEHPFRQFMARGVRVVLATDSLASNPDLSVLNEARYIARGHRDLDTGLILSMITHGPAFAARAGK